MVDKKKTVILAYEEEVNKDLMVLNLCCNTNLSNDLLRLRGEISLNEVIDQFFPGFIHPRRYSYRWGWNYTKHECVDIKYIRNPVDPRVCYLKFVAYDIVG